MLDKDFEENLLRLITLFTYDVQPSIKTGKKDFSFHHFMIWLSTRDRIIKK